MSPMESMDWNAPLPKPVSKSEMSKASNLDGDISTNDLRRYNWQAIIAEHPDKQSLSYFEPLRLEAERLRAAHAAALETVKAEAHRDMQIIVREAEAEQQSILADARSEAERRLADTRIRIAEEIAVARQGLRVQVEEIAREVVRKVLGRAA